MAQPAGSVKSAAEAPPAAEECEQRIRRLELAEDRLTQETGRRPTPELTRHVELLHGTETWAMGTEEDDLLRLPLIARGGLEIDRPTVKLTMKADGTIRFPWTQPIAKDEQGPVYGVADISGRLRRAIGRELRDRRRPLLILADGSIAARTVARVCDQLPRGASARLAVRKPASTFVAEHVARFPSSPGWFTPILEQAYTARGGLYMLYGHAGMIEALARAGGGCPDALKPIEMIKHGADIHYGVEKLVKAARACGCRDMDIEAIASAVFLFATLGTTWSRYVELPASTGRNGAFDLEPGDAATVADLAAALAGR